MVNSQADFKNNLEYQIRLNKIYRLIHEGERFDQVLPIIEGDMLSLLKAARLTVYQRDRHRNRILSKYKTADDVKNIILPIGPRSIAGYVAMSGRSVLITDVYDEKQLKQIHPQLSFDKSFDIQSGWRSRSMISVPIKFKETLLGVLQIMNCVNGCCFPTESLDVAEELAHIIGQKFRYEFQVTNGPFDDLLMKRAITEKQLNDLKKKSEQTGQSIAFLMISSLKLSPEQVGASLERHYQVPFMTYHPEIAIPYHLLKKLSRSYMKASFWVPVAAEKEKVTILIDDPNDYQRIMEIQKVFELQSYDIRVGIREDILKFIEMASNVSLPPVSRLDLKHLIKKLHDEKKETDEADLTNMTAISENSESTISQLVNRLLLDGYKENASDIHIEPGIKKTDAWLRMRIDGYCREISRLPAVHIPAIISRVKVLSRLDISEHRRPQDGKISIKIEDRQVEARVATIPTINGESVILRLLSGGEILPLNKLHLSNRNKSEILKVIEIPHGIFLVVGPTGSGKTTTLHAILKHLNKPDRKIWTAEDPVEIVQPGLQQLEINSHIGVTFSNALRAFLRADPDIILVGEMRDQETVKTALEASLTGHFVLSTLHTNSAAETITRLLNLGVKPIDFADALKGILAQRLVRTLCRHCKRPAPYSADELTKLRKLYNNNSRFDKLISQMPEIRLFRPRGCQNCAHTGYKGRIGVHELLIADDEMKHAITQKKSVSQIEKLSIENGMSTIMQDGIEKILAGHTNMEQLRRVAV